MNEFPYKSPILGSKKVLALLEMARYYGPVPEFIDPVSAKTSPKRSFSITENDRFGLVLVKTGSISLGTGVF
jgi:hypothetical protein